EECQVAAWEHAAIQACCAGHLSFVDLNLLDPPSLVFPYREALYEDDWGSSGAPEEKLGGEFYGIHNLESLDEVIEVKDQIYATTLHLLPSIKEIQASQTTSQWLVQAFATNSPSWAFQDVVPPYLHNFEDTFSRASFDSLSEHKQ
ncbi:hypothetical protein C0993_009537, partial [Termitomyces sp. T159_Od127]